MYALISVADKTNVASFAERLVALGFDLLSTAGTARALREHGLDVVDVSEVTGVPAVMDGRVKTLHPRIFGGILGRRGIDDAVMDEQQMPRIDLVVVNLYPFAQTVARPDVTDEQAVEQIDIGGPALLRAAAKNHQYVGVVVDPNDYMSVADAIADNAFAVTMRRHLAAKAFAHTANYDAMIAKYFTSNDGDTMSAQLQLSLPKQQQLRYGENPHQSAAFYVADDQFVAPLQGKPLSYNNLLDIDTAVACVSRFADCACVIVKHAMPCGVAIADRLLVAFQRAYAADSESAFGGIIACNRPLDIDTARAIVETVFAEVVVAPAITAAAQTVLAGKKNLRVLNMSMTATAQPRLRSACGGVLVQTADGSDDDNWSLATTCAATPAQLQDLHFAWQVARHTRSNAIVYARDGQTLGIGQGQTSRIFAARIAALRAEQFGLPLSGAVLASDGFFPFADSIDHAASLGIAAIVQPGGARRDDAVIAAAQRHGIAMYLTGVRHFSH